MSLDPPISRADGPRAVILLPTRELASQTADVFVQLTKSCIRIVSGCLIGGTKRKSQKASLRKGLNIIISTPQRLLDHLGKTSSLTLKGVRWLVIDEADRLVELGFERDVRRIIERVSREVSAIDGATRVQTVLLSATLTPGVENLAGLALRDPVRCEVSEQPSLHSATSKSDSPTQESVTAPPAAFAMPTGLKHFLLVCPCKLRLVTLAAFLLLKARYNKRSGKIIVFFATQDCVDFHYRLFSETLCDTNDDVHSPLTTSDLNLFRLHGSMDHKDRFPVFQAYSNCPNGILLTTDVASRGLDLAGVAWVIQYHVSGTPVDYVHRVGRTARAGGRGKALLMLLPEEETYASTLRSTVGIELRKLEVADVLQTALFHVNNSAKMASRKKASVTTVEEAASSLSRYLLSTVSQDSELQALAEKAYLSFLRAYASFSGPMRTHFTFRRLHLGHVARAFCLQEAPSDIAAKVTGRRGASGHNEKTPAQRRRPHSTASSPPPVQKSRRLDFDADSTKQPTRALKHKPAELATRNMLAEYVLCCICWFFGGECSLPWFLGLFFRFVAWSPGLFLPHNSFLLAMEKCELSNGEIARYSRQLIIPEFGPHGQQKLTDSRVLIVGCGGLGCPAAVYLAAAGVSRLTLVDDDVVEVSNLHRQVMHSEEKVGTPKVESLAERLRSINHHVIITTHNVHLTNQNACEIVAGHDVVLDCTDNVATRYLLNDACAACGPLPLVSGSALRLDGQLTVYLTAQPPSRITAAPDEPTKRNRQGEEDGLAKRRAPCYRCIHPIPPPSTSVQGCSDAGVIGVVPGIIGTMQAAETIKILTGIGESIAGRLFIMDMAKNTTRSVELRKPRPDCKTCAPSMLITPEIVKQTDYMEFCGAPNCDVPRQPNLAMGDTRITVEELKALRDNNSPHLLIDIRPSVEVEICRLKGCLYIPLPELYRDSNLTQICSHIRNAQPPGSTKPYPVILICRRGNKSHSTANLLASALEDMLSRANLQSNPDLFALDNGSVDSSVPIVVRDVAGGLQAWSEKIDPNFPQY
ncbi:hypothetical protein AAHC03_010022 [Spirometra sp. Aus1]